MSGTYYASQPLMPFIGATKDAAENITLSPVTLTATNTNNTAQIDVDGMQQLTLYIKYTTGAGGSNTVLNMTVQFSPDGTNYYQEATEGVATNVITEYQGTRKFTGAAAGTAYSFVLDIPLAHKKKVKILFHETNQTAFGTLSVLAVPSGQ